MVMTAYNAEILYKWIAGLAIFPCHTDTADEKIL